MLPRPTPLSSKSLLLFRPVLLEYLLLDLFYVVLHRPTPLSSKSQLLLSPGLLGYLLLDLFYVTQAYTLKF